MGSRLPANAMENIAKLNADKPLAALNGDATEILDRLRENETVQVIAVSLGITDQALYAFLLRNCPEQWAEISAGRALSRVQAAHEDLDQARDKLDVAKAREKARQAEWMLERVARRMYGDSKAEGGVTVNVHVDRSCDGSVTIEQEVA